MKRFLTLALVGAVTLGAGSVAYANVCAFDPVPAATLLFPFVTYNYDLEEVGYNTLLAITNVSSEATIAHVTVWTDFSAAILDFNILLTGYDVQTFSMRDILRDGQLPVTVARASNAGDGAFEDGPVSGGNDVGAWDPINLPLPQPTNSTGLGTRCPPDVPPGTNPFYPGNYVTPINADVRALFEGWLKGSQTLDRFYDDCDGDEYVPPVDTWFTARDETDNTWMYITVDVVHTCNTLFPDESAYWNQDVGNPDGLGEPRFENILMGDIIYVNPPGGDDDTSYSEAINAVHIEADGALPSIATGVPTGFPASFYHRYASNATIPVADYREPLPTAWAFRYFRNEGANLDTYVRAWKGSMVRETVADLYSSGVLDQSPPDLIALNCIAYTYYVWDEEENVTSASTDPYSWPAAEDIILNRLPLETQSVSAGQFNILPANTTGDQAGWFLFIWPQSNGAGPPNTEYDWYQTWMGVQYVLGGAYSAAREGLVMANYNCFSNQVLPQLGYFYRPPVE